VAPYKEDFAVFVNILESFGEVTELVRACTMVEKACLLLALHIIYRK
jgi:hypothetical protein